jgi:hypothetical protein
MMLKYVNCGQNKKTADIAKLKECAENGWIATVGKYDYSGSTDIMWLIGELEGTIPTEGYKEGDILNTNWGFEQTNVEFYQVVRATEKSVWIREIDNEDTYFNKTMTGKKTPIPGKFANERVLKRKMPLVGRAVYVTDFIPAYRWNGLPKDYSSYA